MKRYRIVTSCIVLMLLLIACGQASVPDSTSQSDQTTVEVSADQTTEAPTAVVADATPAAEEPTPADESDGASWSGNSFANKLDTLPVGTIHHHHIRFYLFVVILIYLI